MKDELIELARNNNIIIEKITQNIKSGWCDKPKGMLQILWEQGWIDSNLVKTSRTMRYSKSGKKIDMDKETGVIKEECKKFSLVHLLSKCKDFSSEKSDMEMLCDELSSNSPCQHQILFTPKYHC